MNWVSVTCFGVFFLLAVSAFRRGADPFHPARLFAMVWTIVIGLTELKLSRLQHTWGALEWIQVLLGPVSFLLGVFVVVVVYLAVPVPPVAEVRARWKGVAIDSDRLFRIIVALFALYVLAFAVITLLKGVTPPLFSARPGEARREFTMFGIGLFLHNVVLVVYFSMVYALRVRGQRVRKMVLLSIGIASVISYFFLLQRFQLVLTVVVCVVLAYYATRHFRPATLVPYTGVAVGLFYLVSSLRSGIELYFIYLYKLSQMRFPRAYAVFTEPYMYFVMNVENLARAIARHEQFTMGYYTFDFMLALTGLKHWIASYFGLTEMPYLISDYNTYTGYWVYYRDFGPLGLVVFPLALGIAIGLIYYSLRTRPGLSILTVYGGCVFLILFSFFNNPLTFLWFVYNIIVAALVLRWVIVRESQASR